MEPTIHTGAVVLVAPADTYAVDDVITFETGGVNSVPITHRIVGIDDNGLQKQYTTKGDANEDADANTVRANKVLGKVLVDVPYVGYAVAASRKPLGFLLIIVIPGLFIIYDEIVNIIREIKKKKNK